MSFALPIHITKNSFPRDYYIQREFLRV